MIPVESAYPPGWIAVATSVTPRFIEFWDQFSMLKVPHGTARTRLSGPDCDHNRNRGIKAFLQSDEDNKWMFFMDDDQEFPSDILMCMLKIMQENINDITVLSGWYVRKTPPFAPVMFREYDEEHVSTSRVTYRDLEQAKEHGDLLRVGANGAGCLLIKRSVLEQLDAPWFDPGPARQYGGDIGFSIKLKNAGIPLYVWLDGNVGHTMPSCIQPTWVEEYGKHRLEVEFLYGGKGFQMDSARFPDMLAQQETYWETDSITKLRE